MEARIRRTGWRPCDGPLASQSPELRLGIHRACRLAPAKGRGTQARLCRCPARTCLSPAPLHLGLARRFPLRIPPLSALALPCPGPSSSLGVAAQVPSVAVLCTLASWTLVSFFCPTRRNSRRDLNKPNGTALWASGGRNTRFH